MSEKQVELIIEEYLKIVKKKLPDWLKDDKNEIREIMSQLRDHLWSKAEELSDTGIPTEESARLAIAHMGSPDSIVREYKKRGTPYMYITKELWPLYKKVLAILFTVVIILNVISIVFAVIEGNWSAAFNLFGIFSNFAVIFTIVTIIFVVLSKEGYLPEDLKSKSELKREEKELKKARELGMPISPKTGKPLKPFVKPLEKIVGGIFGIAFGFLLLAFPFPTLIPLFHPIFLLIMRVAGLIIIIEGCLGMGRGLIGNRDPEIHQVILIVLIILDLISIPIIIYIFRNPEILPFIIYDDGQFINLGVSSELYFAVNIIFAIIIILTLIGIAENIYNAGKLQRYKVKY